MPISCRSTSAYWSRIPAARQLARGQISGLPPDVVDNAEKVIGYVTDWGQGLAGTFLLSLGGYLMSFSTFIINFSIGIILAYFLSLEIKDWKRIARDKTPNTFKRAFQFLRENVFVGIAGYLKAQGKLISITFVVIFIALLLLGVPNAFSIALLSAFFDILPLLGVGTVFIPWIIYLFIVGQTSLAIWLTALFLLVVLTRQILEPKITGDTLGVSAFTMLAFMIISLSIFGISGVILSPILMILLKALYDQRYFHRWIHSPKGEYENASNPTKSRNPSYDGARLFLLPRVRQDIHDAAEQLGRLIGRVHATVLRQYRNGVPRRSHRTVSDEPLIQPLLFHASVLAQFRICRQRPICRPLMLCPFHTPRPLPCRARSSASSSCSPARNGMARLDAAAGKQLAVPISNIAHEARFLHEPPCSSVTTRLAA